MGDLISVIVPVYNAQDYLELCAESILGQTYRDLELILVNDGSADKSGEICERIRRSDPRVKYIEQSNGGAASARNSGLKLAKGAYYTFVDCDDFVAPDYLTDLYAAAKEGDYDIVQCNMILTDSRRSSSENSVARCQAKEISKTDALNRRMYKVSVCAKIYCAALFHDFSFREGSIYEDDASYYIFVANASKIAVLEEDLYYYYMSSDSVMRNAKKNKSLAFLDIYQERIRFFTERNEPEFVEGTYARLCLVLMLFISQSENNHTNTEDIPELKKLFRRYYPSAVRAKSIPRKDRLMLRCYRYAPQPVRLLLKRRNV